MNDKIIEKMEDAQLYDATLVYKDGHELKGYVVVYETRYDNDNGEASFCFDGEHGEKLIVEEHELADVIVDKDDIFNKMADAYEHDVTLVYKDGRKRKGFVVTCFSQYDDYNNDDDDAKIVIKDKQGKERTAYGKELEDIIIDE